MMNRIFAITAISCAAAGVARADNESLGRVMYEDGVRLFEEGRLDEACPKLKASYDTSASVLVLGRLAQCYERAGKTASAAAAYGKVAADTAADPKLADARAAALAAHDRLQPLVPKLTIAVVAGVEGLVVKCDGEPVPAAAFGVAAPIDPGEHVIRAAAPGFVDFERRVKLTDGGKEQLNVTLEKVGASSPPAPMAVAVAPPPQEPVNVETPGEKALKKGRRAALVVGGAGLGLTAAGVIIGLVARAHYDAANKEYCHSMLQCPSESGILAISQAKNLGTTGTVVGLIGVGALAGGALLYLTASPVVPTLAHGQVAVVVHGRF